MHIKIDMSCLVDFFHSLQVLWETNQNNRKYMQIGKHDQSIYRQPGAASEVGLRENILPLSCGG